MAKAEIKYANNDVNVWHFFVTFARLNPFVCKVYCTLRLVTRLKHNFPEAFISHLHIYFAYTQNPIPPDPVFLTIYQRSEVTYPDKQ